MSALEHQIVYEDNFPLFINKKFGGLPSKSKSRGSVEKVSPRKQRRKFMKMFTLFIIALSFLSCSTKQSFGKYYQVFDKDSLKSKEYVSNIRKLDTSSFSKGEFVGNGVKVKYRFLSPQKIEKDKKYPLVLVFHGSGAIGADNQKQLNALVKNWIVPKNRKKYPAYILAPQFPIRSSNYHIDESRKVLASESNQYLDVVLKGIDSLKNNYNIDENRIYVMGFSMGGSTTMNAISKRPDLFAAAINISGISEFDKMDKLKNMPLWFVHGSLDTDNLPKSNLVFFEEMKDQGKIFFWECKDKWHNNIVSKELIDSIPKWLFKQKKK